MEDFKHLTFGEIIRQKRLSKNMTLRELARQTELSAAFISKMEVGDFRPPKAENIIKIAKILNINEDFLLQKANKISDEIQDFIFTTTRPSQLATFLRKAKEKDKHEEFWQKIEKIIKND